MNFLWGPIRRRSIQISRRQKAGPYVNVGGIDHLGGWGGKTTVNLKRSSRTDGAAEVIGAVGGVPTVVREIRGSLIKKRSIRFGGRSVLGRAQSKFWDSGIFLFALVVVVLWNVACAAKRTFLVF